jgi:hypothetical protein
MAGSVLDSTKLVKSIKRRAWLPEDQKSFSAEDFLEIATEEINIGMMEQIMEARGDYLVYFVDVPLVQDIFEYPLPSRAHGSKLRDVAIIDPSNSQVVYELAQISIDELSDYQAPYNRTNGNFFYMRNNFVVLPNSTGNAVGYSLRMWFYMRPNALVIGSRGCNIQQVTTGVEINNIAPKSGSVINVALGGIVTSTNHGLVGGELLAFNGTNSTPSLDGNRVITYIDANTFSVDVAVTVAGNTGNWNLALEVDILTLNSVPKHFSVDALYDLCGAEAPTKIMNYDMTPNGFNATLKQISFPLGSVLSANVGDYLTTEQETVVPNMPVEYHPIIAQRVAVYCLEAMGDNENLEKARRKLAQMENSVLKIVQNRVEGAPKKIKQRHGTLNQSGWNSSGIWSKR